MEHKNTSTIRVLVICLFCFIGVAAIANINDTTKEAIQRENSIQQLQLENIASSTEETTISTEDQEYANQVISEIQKNNKKIIKLEVYKKYAYQKITPIVIKITYGD